MIAQSMPGTGMLSLMVVVVLMAMFMLLRVRGCGGFLRGSLHSPVTLRRSRRPDNDFKQWPVVELGCSAEKSQTKQLNISLT